MKARGAFEEEDGYSLRSPEAPGFGARHPVPSPWEHARAWVPNIQTLRISGYSTLHRGRIRMWGENRQRANT